MSTPDPTQPPLVDPAMAAAQAQADQAAAQAVAQQQAADQAAQAAVQAQAAAQAELEHQQAAQVAAGLTGNSGPQPGAGATVTVTTPAGRAVTVAAGVSTILGEVEDALSNPQDATKDALAFVASAGAVAVSLSVIPNQTAAAVAAVGAIIIPAVARLVASIRSHGKSNVQAAAIRAKAGQ